MPAHHDLPEQELTDDEMKRVLDDYGGKTRGEETWDSMAMLAGVIVAGTIAILVIGVTAWLLFG